MKLFTNKWLCCGLVTMGLLMMSTPLSKASAHQIRPVNHYIARPYYNQKKHSNSSIKQITSLPNQGYTNYVTGNHGLYTEPATVQGAHRVLAKPGVKRLANRRVPFMAYQKAITNHNLTYYKIVSLHHSVRGWIYETDLRSLLNRRQQDVVVSLNPQIINAEMMADSSKHQSLINHSQIDLSGAKSALHEARTSVRSLKGTADYAEVKQALQRANQYLSQVQKAEPNRQTFKSLVMIRSRYQDADYAVNNARVANLNHQNARAKRDVRQANRDLWVIHRILNKIHNYHDRRDGMNLFNQALSYINSSDNFNNATDLNGNNIDLHHLSNQQLISLINKYVNTAQGSIIRLYPQLGDFDTTLTDAYQAQHDLNQAQNLVMDLKGAHLQQTELIRIQTSQHNINALWNI